MPKDRWRFLTREEASTLMELAHEYHAGETPLPPEIMDLKAQIRDKRRNALLFMGLGAVDNRMVYEVVDLMVQLDTLYGMWASREIPGRLH